MEHRILSPMVVGSNPAPVVSHGVCSIMVMRQFVELEDVGSTPIIHPFSSL